jgi:hypothetical protein
VREQDAHRGAGRAAGERTGGVARVQAVELAAAEVGDAADDERGVAAANDGVLVEQHRHAEPAQLMKPRHDARVVLVVAGDEKASFARAQLRERRDVVGELADGAVDEVASDRDEIDVEAIDGVDDRLDVGPLDRRPDVDVADLRDRETVERLREAGDRDVDANDARGAARVREAPRGDHERGDDDRLRARLDEARRGDHVRQHRGHRGRGDQEEIARHRQHEKGREEAHADQTDPRELGAEALAAGAARTKPVGQRQRGDDEQRDEGERGGERAERGRETPADVGVDEQRDDAERHRPQVGAREAIAMQPGVRGNRTKRVDCRSPRPLL